MFKRVDVKSPKSTEFPVDAIVNIFYSFIPAGYGLPPIKVPLVELDKAPNLCCSIFKYCQNLLHFLLMQW